MAKLADSKIRIEKLKSALQRAKDVKPGIKLEAKPMCAIIGVSWVTLRVWIDDNPSLERPDCMTRGAMGTAYEFNPVVFIESLIEIFAAQRYKSIKANAEIIKNIGIQSDDPEPMDLAQQAKAVDLTLKLVEARNRQGELIEADKVRKFLIGYNENAIAGVMGTRTKIDPSGQLPPEIQVLIDDHSRNVCIEMQRRCEEYIGSLSAGLFAAEN